MNVKGYEGLVNFVEDSTNGKDDMFTAGKMMTQQQASLNAPDSMGFDFQYGDKAMEEQIEASGLGEFGFTGYEGKDYETDKFDIDDRLDDTKFLHGPFVERSPAGGWPMKYALLGEYNPTMSSVIGTTTGYGAYYPKEQESKFVPQHVKATVPDTAMEQWALPVQPESRNYGMFYKGPEQVEQPPKRYPPPTRYHSYTPHPPKPTPPIDCSTRPNRNGESLKKPDPAWGYTGHEHARRYDVGEENLSMATRIAKRRKESIERRFGDRYAAASEGSRRDQRVAWHCLLRTTLLAYDLVLTRSGRLLCLSPAVRKRTLWLTRPRWISRGWARFTLTAGPLSHPRG